MLAAGLCDITFFSFLMSPLSFNNGWTDRNERRLLRWHRPWKKITTAKILVNFGQGTLPWQPILWRDTAKIDTLRLHFVRWEDRCEDRKTYIHTKTPDEPSTFVKILWTLVQYIIEMLDVVVRL